LKEGNKKRQSIVGTPCWMAPEILCEDSYDAKCDIWSIGICAVEMGSGNAPYHDLNPMKALVSI